MNIKYKDFMVWNSCSKYHKYDYKILHIFDCSGNNLRLNIFQLQTRLKTENNYETYEFNAIKNNHSKKFNRIWNPFISLF